MSKDILKENFKTSVVIDEAFKKTLLMELIKKPQNNLYTHIKMNFSAFKKWVYGATAVVSLALVSTGVYVFLRNYYPQALGLDKGYVVTSINGNVKLNNHTIKTKKVELKNGDVVTTEGNGYALIKSNGTNVYVNANSKVEVNSLNDEMYPEVKYGNVYVSSSDGETKVLANAVNIEVTNGAGLFNVVETQVSLFRLAKPAYAAESQSTVANISGELMMGEKKVQPGYEIVISKNKNVQEYELERTKLRTEFCLKVYENEMDEKNDTGTLKDLTAPTVTILSPVSPSKTHNSSVMVTFKSNEDGWYYDSQWIALKANQEVSIKRSLKVGLNELPVTVKDSYYNKTTVKVNVTYEVDSAVSWKQDATNTGHGVYLKWQGQGVLTSDAYVLFRNDSVYKVFDITDSNKYVASYTDTNVVDGKKYYYELKLKRNGQYIADTTKIDIVVQIVETPVSSGCSVYMSTLASASNTVLPAMYSGSHMAKFGWSVSGDCPAHDGYKLVWNTTGSPMYNQNYLGYNYISDNNVHQGTADGLDAGTYYFRVCLYQPSTTAVCSNYSNQIKITF